MDTNTEASNKPTTPASDAISTEEAISLFENMAPNKEVEMRSEMKLMFLSILGAMAREVSEQQIIAGLRKKWPNTHVATIVKLLNFERERRLELGEQIDCKPFGSPRKPKKAPKGNQSQELSHVHASPQGAEA